MLNRQSGYRKAGTNADISVTYEYDDKNNLASMTETVGGVSKTYTYTYDDDNRIVSETVNGVTVEYTYDSFGRLETRVVKNGDTVIHTGTPTYSPGKEANTTTGQIASYNGYTYTYDANGNILTVSDGTNTTSYEYDSANQLIRENNQAGGFTHTWTYDNAGNITSRKEYAYTTGSLEGITAASTVSYTYGDSDWGDLLTGYGTNSITYDTIGNPLSDGEWSYVWQHGRQLASMSQGTTTWAYTYDADGMRTGRTDGTNAYTYVYNGSKLTAMTKGTDALAFTYDASGTPLTVAYNGTVYYYKTNIQGDVIAILDGSGNAVVTYAYDAWGVLLGTNGTMANTLGALNPLRYRGYVYDPETALYYLQSRYYNPEIGRFINADALLSTGQGMLGNNMFAYCGNNPVNRVDYSGTKPGDLFETPDEAALDFAMTYNDDSIADQQEYGSAIYKVKKIYITIERVEITHYFFCFTWTEVSWVPVLHTKTYYSYTTPAIGKNGDSVLPNLSTLHQVVSTVHTHANYDPQYGTGNDNFSDGFGYDLGWANMFRMNIYLATPSGTLKKYTYANRFDENGGVTVISRDIPWDPQHPERKGN